MCASHQSDHNRLTTDVNDFALGTQPGLALPAAASRPL
jgi:hypothetical protein